MCYTKLPHETRRKDYLTECSRMLNLEIGLQELILGILLDAIVELFWNNLGKIEQE